MTNYFITGISGFVGRNLVLALKQKEDIHIYGFVLPNDPALKLYQDDSQITLVEGSLDDVASIARFMSNVRGKSYLIHAAGRVSVYSHGDPLTMKVNYEGTKNIIDEAFKHLFDRIVYVSSVDALTPQKEGTVYAPTGYEPEKCLSDYGKSKALASAYCLKAARDFGMPVVIVCPTAIIGPDDPFLSPMNDAFKKFVNGRIPAHTPGGYDTVDIRDVAKGILLALEKGRIGETYILSGKRVTVEELFASFSKASGKKAPQMCVPFWVLRIAAPFAEFAARRKKKRPTLSPVAVTCLKANPVYDTAKAKEELGYEITPFEQTIEDTYAWLQKAGHIA